MTKTLHLLEEKNMYLEKFMGLNRDWLDRLGKGDFSELENFRGNRENILNIVRHIDMLVESQTQKIDASEVGYDARIRIHDLLEQKDGLVRAILAQDIDIMHIIESAKSQIILELRKVQSGRRTIGSYKSFKRKDTVDEEA